MEETISLRELFAVLRKRLWLIVLITIVAATVSAVISFFVLTPVYQSKTQILVNQAKSDEQLYNMQAVQTNIQLINTYNDIITSPVILDKVIKELKLDGSGQSLSGKIQVINAKDSQVVQIVVQDTNAKRATDIANTTASVFQKEVPKIMNVDNVKVLSKATVGESSSPVKPQPLLNVAIAIVVGLMLGIGLSFLLEYLDNTLKTEQDIENILELPVMGVVTTIKDVPKATNVQRPDITARVPQRGETFGS
ncbi:MULTISPECIES: YveK family protein [Priestia]|uniref:Capsular polysaccharide biosynthesis protein n=1 Tax=Priestia megaterium (strain ATCC 12872 / QMB1551) TaxID=545693 RepID=D5DY80_PRIM1|nr:MULTISPECIES: Wzz/FepE/Etk N-terminal domain-containing protein [Priestia]ADE68162.1 capsular polysaccharide biosynthesis protein [Priestia megaterium QM B1551]MBG9934182.1 capsular biosynthesis protein [Priestia aryabhattai]MED4091360.1 Wzz/FepE/Etk N-terminal domain-containing protein [Priestia megaterium]MUL31482.1 Capsular polysaccharide type 8 biosynthesis protein cap8A [Priestia megaterium]WEZ58094.1 Wzz/FepE/Etk N-terminal domain-containing protein [Priestia megaterium]